MSNESKKYQSTRFVSWNAFVTAVSCRVSGVSAGKACAEVEKKTGANPVEAVLAVTYAYAIPA